MREIKFRAWDKEDEVMFYSKEHNFCFVEADRPDKQCGVIMQGALNCLVDEKMPLMQYTGLKDKNGVEIYEGDIVKGHMVGDGTSINTVSFKQGCFMYSNKKDLDAYAKDYKPSRTEIIGNIYENPELLEDK